MVIPRLIQCYAVVFPISYCVHASIYLVFTRISPKNVRIGGAVLIAVLLIGSAYVLPGINFPNTKAVNAALTDELLANYVAKDTDGEGLPDWQEALYGTDINKSDTDGDGINDAEAVRQGLLTPRTLSEQLPEEPIGEEDFPVDPAASGSITDQFARAFFEAYVQTSNGRTLSTEEEQALADRLVADFTTRASRALNSTYTSVSVRRNPAASVTGYAEAVELVLRQNDVRTGEGQPMELMQGLIERGEEDARDSLARLGDMYGKIEQDLLALQVPPELVDDHLLLVRSFDELQRATELVTRYEEDPLGVMGALAIYQPASRGVMRALDGIANAVLAFGEPEPGGPGTLIINVVRSAQM